MVSVFTLGLDLSIIFGRLPIVISLADMHTDWMNCSGICVRISVFGSDLASFYVACFLTKSSKISILCVIILLSLSSLIRFQLYQGQYGGLGAEVRRVPTVDSRYGLGSRQLKHKPSSVKGENCSLLRIVTPTFIEEHHIWWLSERLVITLMLHS